MSPQDLLFAVFETHLYQPTQDNQSFDDFVENVVVDYMKSLMAHGWSTPEKARSLLIEDLHEEVLEMTRKKTYGHATLAEYRARISVRSSDSKKRAL